MKKTLKDKAANSARNSKTIMKKDKTGKQNGKKVTWKNGAATQHKGFLQTRRYCAIKMSQPARCFQFVTF